MFINMIHYKSDMKINMEKRNDFRKLSDRKISSDIRFRIN
jgi:hypothetical protein